MAAEQSTPWAGPMLYVGSISTDRILMRLRLGIVEEKRKLSLIHQLQGGGLVLQTATSKGVKVNFYSCGDTLAVWACQELDPNNECQSFSSLNSAMANL